jgi:hypothetical protein
MDYGAQILIGPNLVDSEIKIPADHIPKLANPGNSRVLPQELLNPVMTKATDAFHQAEAADAQGIRAQSSSTSLQAKWKKARLALK